MTGSKPCAQFDNAFRFRKQSMEICAPGKPAATSSPRARNVQSVSFAEIKMMDAS